MGCGCPQACLCGRCWRTPAVEPLHLGTDLSPASVMTAAALCQQAQRKCTAAARDRIPEAALTNGLPIDWSSGSSPIELPRHSGVITRRIAAVDLPQQRPGP